MNAHRTILHLDMNAFFASVEQQADPSLQGKPVAVIGSGARTIITTASYEARAHGVRTGMTTHEAKRLCPELILVIGNNREYTRISKLIFEMLGQFTPLVEVFSIDEAFLDLSGSLRLFGSADVIAREIKARILDRFGLTCSIGIAPNKLLAKLASDMQKPDGLTIIPPENVASLMKTTPIRSLCGIGPSTEQRLKYLGISTCNDLGHFSPGILSRHFGVMGARLTQMGQGIDDSPVIPTTTEEEVKSISHSTTLDHDLTSKGDIHKYLLMLSEMVGRRARRYKTKGKTVTLTIRYADFTTFSRQETLPSPLNRSSDIYRAATALLDTLHLTQPIRLLGVAISNLVHASEQLPLFPEEQRLTTLSQAMDQVNDRFGDTAVTFGTLLGQDNCSHVIAPAWRPAGIRDVEVK